MTILEWLTSSYPNPHIEGQWGTLHIITLVLCFALIIAVSLLLRNKSEKTKRIVLWIFVGVLIIFEIARRVINLCKTDDYSLTNILSILLFRPMCAMMSLGVILAVIFNKKWLYSAVAIFGLLATIIFFVYPGVGFNNELILFENLYSIVTHSIIFMCSILFMTLKLCEFSYRKIWQTVVFLAVCVGWAFFEALVLKIEDDAMNFFPDNDVMSVVGMDYIPYMICYVVFMVVYINLFYLIGDRKRIKEKLCRKRISD